MILAPAAFAGLREHPSAVHVRLRAPFDWRVGRVAREQLLDRKKAEKVVRHDDHVQRASGQGRVPREHRREPCAFTLVIDVSRLAPDRIVDLMLAAGGVELSEGEPAFVG